LGSERLIKDVIKEELKLIKNKFGDERKTEIVKEENEVTITDLIANEAMIVMMTENGYIKRTKLSTFKAQNRGGKGQTGIKSKEEDFVVNSFCANALESILFITNKGNAFKLNVYNIPETQRSSKGKPIVNLLALRENEVISSVLPIVNFDENYSIFIATKNGQVIKTSLDKFANVRKGGLIAIRLKGGDEVINTHIADNTLNNQRIVIATKMGQSICVAIDDFRTLGRGAMGVRGIRLSPDDSVVSMDLLSSKDDYLIAFTENGYGKKTKMTEFRKQNKGGKGIIAIKTGRRNGFVVAVLKASGDNDIIIITSNGKIIRINASSLRSIRRNAMGVRLINLNENERVVSAVIASGGLNEQDDVVVPVI